ncbi:coiled-coil domain-containing protein 43 isoform X1 [Nannospalax galili]|uniref:coiled-coil domain-containing protein 43 isoform X1 n=1 Tax=Nannospalax galili TaxID=1026970 RepID=UPI00111C3ACC|nr:coiled-coil domain-containing protein 43 isoform X1 [Nannospalax galili]
MAAPSGVTAAASSEGEGDGGGFGSWLDQRLDALGVDRAVYGAYILGVLQEEEEEEKLDALQGILSAFLEEDSLLDICKEIVERWSETQNVVTKMKKEDEVQAIATLIEKQAQIVVKPRMVSEEEKQRKAALLAQYADVTDEEDFTSLIAVTKHWTGSNLKGRNVSFSLQSELIESSGEEGMVAGAGDSWSHLIYSQEAARGWGSARFLLLIQSRALAQGTVLPTFKVNSSRNS